MKSLPLRKPERVVSFSEGNQRALAKLGIHSPKDFWYHFPTRYSTITETRAIREVSAGETVVMVGTL